MTTAKNSKTSHHRVKKYNRQQISLYLGDNLKTLKKRAIDGKDKYDRNIQVNYLKIENIKELIDYADKEIESLHLDISSAISEKEQALSQLGTVCLREEKANSEKEQALSDLERAKSDVDFYKRVTYRLERELHEEKTKSIFSKILSSLLGSK